MPSEAPTPFPPPTGDQPPPPRAMGRFASFALAMSTMCILAGGITSFSVGFCSVGGAAIGVGWPLGVLFGLAVALTMGQVASAFPRAGGPCEWAAELGGAGWGWVAGCFNLAALVTAIAAVNVGLCRFVVGSAARVLDYTPGGLSPWLVPGMAALVTAAQAFINHRGMRLTTLLTNFSGYLIMVTTAAMAVLLLVCAATSAAGIELSRLVEVSNFSGPAGNTTWPETANLAWLFALGLMLPAYTLTGFDAPAQTAEETRDPEINVPKAIWQAVLITGVAGWVLLSAVVLAAPNIPAAAAQGEESFLWIVRAATPRWTHGVMYTAIAAAQFCCALACITAASRLVWAMARDNGLPFARRLRRIGTHQTPSAAIWAVGVVAAATVLFLDYTAVAAVCAVFFYVAYVIPTACGLFAYGRWPRVGPWHLGRWYPPLAVVCVLGCLGLIALGVQPPNEIGRVVIPATAVALFALWFGYFRTSFRDEITRALRQLPAFRDCHEVTAVPLGGGLTNRNYRLEIGGESYVLRIAGAGAEHLLIDRAREAAAVRAAVAAGVAPAVVDHLPDYSVVVTRFVRGAPLTPEAVRTADTLGRVARVLRAYHDHPVTDGLGAFSVFDVVRAYHAHAVGNNVPLPDELARAMERLAGIEAETRSDDAPCLCHNDLLLGNFIAAGDSLLVIDWEYAGLGNKFFDLGNFAAHNELDAAAERALLEHYFGAATPENLRRLRLMRLASDLREATWGYLQSAVSKSHDPVYYRDYGRKYLDRFWSAANAT